MHFRMLRRVKYESRPIFHGKPTVAQPLAARKKLRPSLCLYARATAPSGKGLSWGRWQAESLVLGVRCGWTRVVFSAARREKALAEFTLLNPVIKNLPATFPLEFP